VIQSSGGSLEMEFQEAEETEITEPIESSEV